VYTTDADLPSRLHRGKMSPTCHLLQLRVDARSTGTTPLQSDQNTQSSTSFASLFSSSQYPLFLFSFLTKDDTRSVDRIGWLGIFFNDISGRANWPFSWEERQETLGCVNKLLTCFLALSGVPKNVKDSQPSAQRPAGIYARTCQN
jgi:hypothetical protein